MDDRRRFAGMVVVDEGLMHRIERTLRDVRFTWDLLFFFAMAYVGAHVGSALADIF
jgi:hypothetical protein